MPVVSATTSPVQTTFCGSVLTPAVFWPVSGDGLVVALAAAGQFFWSRMN